MYYFLVDMEKAAEKYEAILHSSEDTIINVSFFFGLLFWIHVLDWLLNEFYAHVCLLDERDNNLLYVTDQAIPTASG